MNDTEPAIGVKFRLTEVCDALPEAFVGKVCRVTMIGNVDDSYIYFVCEAYENDVDSGFSDEYWILRPKWRSYTEKENMKYDWIGHDWDAAFRKKRDELMRKMFGTNESGDELSDGKDKGREF